MILFYNIGSGPNRITSKHVRPTKVGRRCYVTGWEKACFLPDGRITTVAWGVPRAHMCRRKIARGRERDVAAARRANPNRADQPADSQICV